MDRIPTELEASYERLRQQLAADIFLIAKELGVSREQLAGRLGLTFAELAMLLYVKELTFFDVCKILDSLGADLYPIIRARKPMPVVEGKKVEKF